MSAPLQQVSLKTVLPFSILLMQHFALSLKKHNEMHLANYALGIPVKLIKIHFLIKLMLGKKISNIYSFIYSSERLQRKN